MESSTAAAEVEAEVEAVTAVDAVAHHAATAVPTAHGAASSAAPEAEGALEVVHLDASQVATEASSGSAAVGTSDAAAAVAAAAAAASAAVSAAAAAATSSKRPWSDEEDKLLLQAIAQFGAQRWPLIATIVQHGRAGKQCRERWYNHLCPDVKKGEWTPDEDRLIQEAVDEMGTKWAQIARRFPGRTENSIKNRYNSIKRKADRREKSLASGKRKRDEDDGGGSGQGGVVVASAIVASSTDLPCASAVVPAIPIEAGAIVAGAGGATGGAVVAAASVSGSVPAAQATEGEAEPSTSKAAPASTTTAAAEAAEAMSGEPS